MNDVKNVFIILPRNFHVIERACTGQSADKSLRRFRVPTARPQLALPGFPVCGAVRLAFRRLVAGHFYRWLIMSKPIDLREEINSLFRVGHELNY
ncbi:hypothetical protein [Rhizobium sp. GCM10022189]|uniref:hypothetical protein n=1 Tax=Rhizobium sp. GCM10022189 TaxID=3252654 RepID=UPI00360C9F5A